MILADIPPHVTLIAMSKGSSLEAIASLAAKGQKDFGENYVQELIPKAIHMPELRWHFCGHLQRNKVTKALPHLACLHTLGSMRLFEKLEKEVTRNLPVFIQVNPDREPQKSGLDPHDPEFLQLIKCVQSSQRLQFLGFMAIPAKGSLHAYDCMQALTQSYQCQALSLGMSEDRELALAHGATHLRIGRALFESTH